MTRSIASIQLGGKKALERGSVRGKCLAQEHNTMTRSGLKPEPPNLESSMLNVTTSTSPTNKDYCLRLNTAGESMRQYDTMVVFWVIWPWSSLSSVNLAPFLKPGGTDRRSTGVKRINTTVRMFSSLCYKCKLQYILSSTSLVM